MSLHSLHNMLRVNPNDIRGVSNRRQRMPRQPHAIPFGAREHTDVLDIFNTPIRMPEMPLSEREKHLTNLAQVLRHARSARDVYSNLSKRHYGAMVILDNGIQSIGTNVEASRQTAFCDLRSAITQGINQSIALSRDYKVVLPTPKVKTVYLVNATVEADSPIPCSDCQEWLNSRFCSSDTEVISLEKDSIGTGTVVRSRTVGEMLPLHKGRAPVRLTTERPIYELPVDTSPMACNVLNSSGGSLSALRIKKMLGQAQLAYQRNQTGSAESGLKTGVCMQISPLGQMVSGGRFDWSTRWYESADLATAAKAFEKADYWQSIIQSIVEKPWLPDFLKQQLQPWLGPPKIQAIAYYGDDPNLPPLASLGRIARHRGSSNTLIATVENDRIHIRTISDFMPEMYRTKSGR